MTRLDQENLSEFGLMPETIATEIKKKRRTRSDAGVPKGPKLVKQAPAAAGVLSDAQAAELRGLAEKMVATAKDLADAQRRNLQAAVDYFAYLDSLTAKN